MLSIYIPSAMLASGRIFPRDICSSYYSIHPTLCNSVLLLMTTDDDDDCCVVAVSFSLLLSTSHLVLSLPSPSPSQQWLSAIKNSTILWVGAYYLIILMDMMFLRRRRGKINMETKYTLDDGTRNYPSSSSPPLIPSSPYPSQRHHKTSSCEHNTHVPA